MTLWRVIRNTCSRCGKATAPATRKLVTRSRSSIRPCPSGAGIVLADKVGYFIKAAQTQIYNKDAGLYLDLAVAYQDGEYANNEYAYNKLRADEAKPDVTNELKAYQESADRLIDALARAINFATPAEAKIKEDSRRLITALYKFRNQSAAGLQEFIAGVPAKPLPQPGQPIDYFPASPTR